MNKEPISLAQYQNGNCAVQIFDDGTRIIDYEPPAAPEFPVSIDLKITNRCDAGCPWCHEEATPDGEHADPEFLLNVLAGLPHGAEIAIGGGDPLRHPRFATIINNLWLHGLVVNVTVNARHIKPNVIRMARHFGWIRGLGISYVPEYIEAIGGIADANTVIHFIAGIHKPEDVVHALQICPKALILGYKRYGRGEHYGVECSSEVEQCLNEWRRKLPPLLKYPGVHIGFDNLALKQLDVKGLIPAEQWETLYQGDDGEFTMYIDAVKRQYAVSSTSQRKDITTTNIRTLFADVRTQSKGKKHATAL